MIKAEVLISELDRELANNQQGIAMARSALGRQLHIRPDTELKTSPLLSFATVPPRSSGLIELAIAARPELQGRLAAIARDEKAIELARKRFYPNVTLGLTYMDMEKTNAAARREQRAALPTSACSSASICRYTATNTERACARPRNAPLADAKLYEAQRDETLSEIQDLMVQARVQQNVLTLLRDSILPRTKESLELARSDYAKSNVDYATVLSTLREVLQVQLQIAQVEAELAKALAALERAVGCQINEHPPGKPSRAGRADRETARARTRPHIDIPAAQFRGRKQGRRLIEGIAEIGWHHAGIAGATIGWPINRPPLRPITS